MYHIPQQAMAAINLLQSETSLNFSKQYFNILPKHVTYDLYVVQRLIFLYVKDISNAMKHFYKPFPSLIIPKEDINEFQLL